MLVKKVHSLNRNGKKQVCLTCPFPYTLLWAFGLFFVANIGEAACVESLTGVGKLGSIVFLFYRGKQGLSLEN